MKNRNLLGWGLAAGAVAVIAYVLGWLFFWPTDAPGNFGRYGGYGGMMDGGPGGMMGGGYGGMMGGGYGGMMGGGMMGGGMMGTFNGPTDTATAPLTIDQANDSAKRYLDYWENSDLKVSEVIEFTNGFYALVKEQSTGAGAFEILIDRNTGIVTPEPGPNLTWNTKYGIWGTYGGNGAGGMMGGYGGMMGGRYGRDRSDATTDMPVDKDEARNRAQQFLDRQLPGTRAGDPDTIYGYYTIEVEKDGKTLGMLGVDGYYGQVWYHSWHGAYLSEKQY